MICQDTDSLIKHILQGNRIRLLLLPLDRSLSFLSLSRWVERPPTAPSSCRILALVAPLREWSLQDPGFHLPAQGCIPLTLLRRRRCPNTEAIREGSRGLNAPFIQRSGGVVFAKYTPYQSSLDQQRRTGSNFNLPRVFQCSSMVPLACPGIRPSLCSTPLALNSDAPLHLLTRPVGCLSWASTPLDLTVQYSSPLEPLSPILHSIIR